LKIIVTGVAGFIGYHFANKLLKDGHEVYGIDNLNDYYDSKLKLDRLDLLKSNKNFIFEKIDISNKKNTARVFRDFKPEKVVNLAAQAGVRYSLINPDAYMKSNLVGFLNILELCRSYNVNSLIYASSSSVYGDNEKKPFSVKDRAYKPVSLYGATKRSNEIIAHSYSHLYGIKTTGLRYFTVYGPWYRPDMAMYIFARKICKNEPIEVYNNGKMKRDFTYIDDVVDGTISAMKKNYNCEVFNIGNNKSEELMDLIKLIEQGLNKKAVIEYKAVQPGDVLETFADIDYSTEKLSYLPKINIDEGVYSFIKWFKEYHNV
tara:strand:+ start:4819 stop:5772 length:954 start_codon:yes stop_codon:yes gene_type:complete